MAESAMRLRATARTSPEAGPQEVPRAILADAARRAAAEDRGGSIAPTMDALLASGALDATAPAVVARTLVRIAECNLSAARLAEGHVNARRLLGLHGVAAPGGLLGVWGADDTPPVRVEGGRLTGRKRYASGLGVVAHAVVTVGTGTACRLALVAAGEPARHRPGDWDMLGMRATRSGGFDAAGLVPLWVGAAGDYLREPWFLGGTWRIAALQAGGTLGLLASARDDLRARGRLEAPPQVARLAPLVTRALAALALVERAAAIAEGPEGIAAPDRAVAASLGARLLTEEIAQDAIKAVERAVGLPHFEAGAETGRRARDLSTYCRQIAHDAMLQTSGALLLAGDGPLSEAWYG